MKYNVGDKVTIVGMVTRVGTNEPATVRLEFDGEDYYWFTEEALDTVAVNVEHSLPTTPGAVIEVDTLGGGRGRFVLSGGRRWHHVDGLLREGHLGPFKNCKVLFDGKSE